MDSQNLRLGRFALPCLLALASAAALGQEPNPYYVGASQAFTYESNVFRTSPAGPVLNDWLSSTSLLAGIDQPIGRQRLFGDVALRHQRYSDNSHLDHAGGSVLFGLDWAAADVLSGRISVNAEKSLARYGADLGVVFPAGTPPRNLQTSQELVVRGQYGLASLLTIDAGFVRRQIDFSASAFALNEFEQDTVSLGLRYRPTGPLSLGIAVRRTDGLYPAVPDDFERDDLDLSALWVATGQSTITARLSRTKEKHRALALRNLSETTGALAWTYKPTGKVETTLDLIRDTGAESTFALSAATGAATVIDTSTLSTTVMLRGQYDVTSKIQLQALLSHQERDLVGGEDKTREVRLGVNWSPLRSVRVGCSVGREKRDSPSTPALSYTASTGRCLAQFRTQ